MFTKRWQLFGLVPLLVAIAMPAPSRKPQTQAATSILSRGLSIWRKSGKIDGGAACATCHSPDGIELAVYNFDDADLQRRAQPHVGDEDAQLLVVYIHALRAKFHFTHLRDRNEDRPLQPGGSVLAGDTPAARDLAFGYELKTKLPSLFDARIETVEQAQKAEAELLSLQPVTLKVGIPFNRLSEDVAHGNEHSSIAQWLPEVPPLISAADLPAWYAAEDRYLADPTQDRLHELLLQHGRLVNTSRMLGLSALSAVKFRALLVWQDRIRNGTENDPIDVSRDVLSYGNFNPIWEVGDGARDIMGRDPNSVGMDRETQGKKLSGPSFAEQLHELRVSWFWAGWLSDQGLFKTSHDDKTRLGMWFSESLSKDGPYPIHNVYSNARRQAVASNVPEAWGEPPARKRRIWDFAGLRSFEFETRDLPKDLTYRNLYIRFTANCFRMNLLLLEDDISKTHQVWAKISTRANVGVLIEFIKSYDTEDAANAAKLQRDLLTLIATATERF